MTYAKLSLLAVFAFSASAAAAQTTKPPAPVHADILQAVRLHAATLRSQPIRLNSEPLHPSRVKSLFPGSSLPPVAMTDEKQPDVPLVFSPPAK